MFRLTLVAIALMGLSDLALARNKALTHTQLRTRLNAIQTMGNRAGVPIPVAYALPSAQLGKGAKVNLGRGGEMVVRDNKRVVRVRTRANQIIVKSRSGAAHSKRALHVRKSIKLLGRGLATSTRTTSRGRQSNTSHYVEWKNGSAFIKAPLSDAQLSQLRRELVTPQVKFVAGAKALFKYRSMRAIPGLQLEAALNRMGLTNSVDWR